MAEEMRKLKSTMAKVGSLKQIPSRPNVVASQAEASMGVPSDVGDRKPPSKKIVLRLIEFFKQ